MTVAVIFKAQHWPGASIALVLGCSLACIFLWLRAAVNLLPGRKGLEIAMEVVQAVGLSILVMGFLFKVQHWPGGSFMMTMALTCIFFGFIPLFILIARKNRERYKIGAHNILAIAIISVLFIGHSNRNIARTVISHFVLLHEAEQANQQALQTQINWNYEQLQHLELNAPLSANGETIQAESKALIEHVCLIQDYLIRQSARIPESFPEVPLHEVHALDNFDIPTNILIGDPMAPKTDEWSGFGLKQRIDAFRNAAVNELASEESLDGLRTDDIRLAN